MHFGYRYSRLILLTQCIEERLIENTCALDKEYTIKIRDNYSIL